MKIESKATRGYTYLCGLYIVISLLLVSYIPTLIPGNFVASESYIFGYNNRIGFGLVLLLTGIGAILFRNPRRLFPLVEDSNPVHPATLWTCIGLILAAGIGMYFLTSRLGNFGESTYFINRIELLSRGLRPYRDFEFAYGACLIYVPLFLSRLLHLSIPNAYYLFWILNLGLGTWFLAEVINRIDYPGRHRRAIFLAFFIPTLVGVLFVGVNYTCFRFALAPLLAIAVYRTIQEGRLQSQIAGSLLAPFFTLLLLLVSPEIAVAFALGISAFMLMFYLHSARKRWLFFYLVMLLLLGLLMAAANHFQIFETFKSFATGGFNFPIIPSPSILLFLFCIFICARLALYAVSRDGFGSNYVCVLLVALPLLAPAFGRCDPAHIFWDGLAILLLGFLWASGDLRAWKWFLASFAVIFIILSSLSGLWLYRGELGRTSVNLIVSQINSSAWLNGEVTHLMSRRFGDQAAKRKIDKFRLLAQQDASKDMVELPLQLNGVAEAPFGYTPSHNPTSLDFGYYFGLDNVLDPKEVTRKITELEQASNRELLVPAHYAMACSVDPAGSRNLIRTLFAYPYWARSMHTQSIYQPLCAYISTHYALTVSATPETYDYEIWAPK